MKRIILITLTLVILGACSDDNAINERNLHKHIEILASDDFGGRAPGSDGGEKTKDYIKKEFLKSGLVPIKEDFYLDVPLSKMVVDVNKSSFSIETKKGIRKLSAGSESVFWSKQVKEEISMESSELVFVGYGVVAPEYGWNDYKDIDVRGKTLVMLINDPGFYLEDPDLFKGKAMTYYGRWVYKFEEAARQGAEAVLIIHETAPAAYPWQVVETSWTGKQIDLKREDMGASRVKIEGWITSEVAKELFSESGLDLDALKKKALDKNFTAVPMGNLKANATLFNEISFANSHNVAGIKMGSKHPDEYVLMMAHWDHLGTKDEHSITNDHIYNGAVDNASGVAGILELANYFKSIETERSLLFLAVTAEESGLLGSQYFAEYPPIDLSKVVAGYNFDAVLPVGKTKDVIVVGYGASELEDILKTELDKLDKYITPDPQPEKGYFYRSDHISLAKKGVPVLYADGGVDKIIGG
ncbi:MAG: M28 family metallopeptidase, partial [SAR86 cluster bacterium]|nr:M28 family metallopeptidase [SAR86 cluster bacterium]